ncbi:DUF2812 domain-containing protein [Tenuibacillus multivorans]|uniref:DUF2812 domain-containing protein n=1 Tax=Tenuibacillus multivorans TaxID=237069 RepID=A0A1H0BPJ6_9BACI|nr:DUF2812 domain-containing protein [Tenuibacillus multivorans]GEL77086.1 hypothetical protein TMU01_13210 [Tenuibacillus multivorans]SDN47502.1 Protein of unknown function [Tenuibacillus multivorans]
MTVKKEVKLLWSYKIDKTERWLSEMAEHGWHLTGVNQWTRTFTFKKGNKKNVTYRIQYGPKSRSIPLTLQKEGWDTVVSEGRWLFLKNEEANISLYPTRDEVVRRNRTHAYIFSALAIFQLATHIPIILLSIVSLTSQDDSFFLEDSLWILLFLLAVGIGLAFFAIYVFKAYRRFELREMDATTDLISKGKKMRKFKLGWMYHLEETKTWLEKLAEDGYELEKVTASIFTFREIEPSNIKYECIFEYKVQPSFFTTHKEFGWKLKYSSNMTLLNYSIWAKHYNVDEPVPQFSYDKEEQKQSIKRAFKMNIGISFYLILLLSFSLYMNYSMDEPFITWSFSGVMRPLLLALLLFWVYMFVQILLSYRKSMREYKNY